MNGQITRLVKETVTTENVRKGGFGFLRDENEDDRFFHHTDVRGVSFRDLTEGAAVEFDAVDHPKGLRAEKVRVR